MAKGNPFLGTAANSVGDVVMYRREGSQVSRVRVRKIANPKTEAQCRQRAYMAPIPKFFSPLAVVLERSFEGLSKAKSYAKFIKVNANKARTNDWLLPKGIGFFPLPYQLSQGIIPSCLTQYYSSDDTIALNSISFSSDPTTIGDLSSAFVAKGYKNGDVVTLIAITGDKSNIKAPYIPIASQFIIDEHSTDLVANVLPDITFVTTAGPSRFKAKSGTTIAGAVIVARFENEKWRRSTETLAVANEILTAIGTDAYKAAAIESYSAAAGGANPMVYLDGEELNNA